MASYGVYQFTETLETCVLPTNWVVDGEVKYDSRKASDYAKKGKMPYKKLRTYKVELICKKLFDSYETAYRAEAILLEKSDLESTDIEAINKPTKILTKKKDKETNFDLSSSGDDNIDIKLPPFETIVTELGNITNKENSEAESGDANKISGTPIILKDNQMQYSLATESQILELKELIREQHNLIQMQNTKIEDLIVVVTNMSTQLKHLKLTGHNIDNDDITIVTRWAFPLKTTDEVKELEENLKNDENGSVKEFKFYLVQLGGATLKASIKWIVRKIYSLDLQQKMNYCGRKNKFPTKHLIQTKLILDAKLTSPSDK
nr:unnamed protein product [Callosobruchus analis]